MATDAANKLNEMFRNIPDQAAALDDNISDLQDIKDELNEQISAVQDGICGVAETNARDLIDNTILPIYQGIHGPLTYVSYGSEFGIIQFDPAGNLEDWTIYTPAPPVIPPAPPLPDIPVYSYTPGDYPDLDVWVADYDYGNDYLTKELDETGTYGLIPQKDNIDTAISLLTTNKDKIEGGLDVFPDYLP